MKNGWLSTTLGSICSFENGDRGSNYPGRAVQTASGIPFINAGHLTDDGIDLTNMNYIPKERFELLGNGKIRPGDILFCLRGSLGKFASVGNLSEGAIASSLVIIRPTVDIESKFLLMYLQSNLCEVMINRHKNGAAQPNLSARCLMRFEIPLPPLPEQRRIVGILDEAFAGIATAKANAAKNLQNARALFESHLNAVFTQRGDDWERLSLAMLLERGWIESHLDGNHGGDYPRKHEFISEGIPYISANCLDDERIDMTKAKYLSPKRAALLRKGIAKDGDVLFAHNATVGPVAILRTDKAIVILGTSLTYYRCNRNHILPEYLAHYMRSFMFKVQYLQVMRQSTRNQVPITTQREFFHVIPPVDEQRRIVRELDGLFDDGRRLTSIYRRKLSALDELKKSLLHRAFSGAL